MKKLSDDCKSWDTVVGVTRPFVIVFANYEIAVIYWHMTPRNDHLINLYSVNIPLLNATYIGYFEKETFIFKKL